MSFELRHDYYSGPMEKLLALIEERELEVTRVNLASVTADFIAYVEGLGESVSPEIFSDFIVIAARLLVIKSKELIPNLELTEEEESNIMDLEVRLKLYREFKAAGELLKRRWEEKTPLYGRPFLSGRAEDHGVFYPSAQITRDGLHGVLEQLLHVVADLVPETKTVAHNGLVTLQQKMNELITRLKNQSALTIRGRASVKEKQEVIVMFLAILHLLAGRLAEVDQEEQFGDILVSGASANSW